MAAPPHIAVATHKGGSGKTKVLELMAAAAAENGEKVLVVDMDAQANTTRRLKAKVPDDPALRADASLARVLLKPGRGEAERILVPSGWGGFYSERIMVAPAHLELELLPQTAMQAMSSQRLLRALTGVADDFDLVLIDCPPNLLSHLIDNAWTASDLLFVPVEAEYDGVEAARRVVERVKTDHDQLNPDLKVLGFVINRFRANLGVHKKRLNDVNRILGPDAVCPTRFPELVAFKNGSEFAMPMAEVEGDGPKMAHLAKLTYKWMRARADELMGAQK